MCFLPRRLLITGRRLSTRTWGRFLLVLLTILVWDVAGVAYTRLVVAQSDWSLPLAAGITGLWWLGIKWSQERWVYGLAAVIGAVIGTWIGMR